MEERELMSAVFGVVGTVVLLAAWGGVLIVGLTTVRRRSPPASGLIGVGAGIGMFTSLFRVAYPFLMIYFRASDMSATVMRMNALGLGATVLSALGLAFLAAGIARLAARPRDE